MEKQSIEGGMLSTVLFKAHVMCTRPHQVLPTSVVACPSAASSPPDVTFVHVLI